MNRPQPDEFAIFYKGYVDTVPDDVLTELERQVASFAALIDEIPEDKGDFAYAPGKWSVKTLLGHVIDTERIMVYRALRIARNDRTPLAGFEENDYAASSHYADRSLPSLSEEFRLLRTANLFLFRSFTEEELSRIGTASEKQVSTRALLFIAAGHVNHHCNILRGRYLG